MWRSAVQQPQSIGSRLLLDSLIRTQFRTTGEASISAAATAARIAGSRWKPRGMTTSIGMTRVAFARHNANQLPIASPNRARFTSDITVTPPEGGYDLIL